MRYSILFLLAYLMHFNSLACFASESDSTIIPPNNPVSTINEKQLPDKFEIIAIGGIGMTTGSCFGDWESQFSNGPAFGLGFELPFTKAHIFSLEVYGHIWMSKISDRTHTLKEGKYSKLSQNYYSQRNLSAVIKYYLPDYGSKLRTSFHFGVQFLSSYKNYGSLDLGMSLDYTIDERYHISLTRKIFTHFPNLAGGNNEDNPNLLMLNFGYLFRL